LFHNYNGPPKQTFGPGSQQQPDAAPYVDMANMTAEERDEAQANMIRGETNQIRDDTEASLDRSLGLVEEALRRGDEIRGETGRQREILLNANRLGVEAEVQTKRSDVNVKDLNDATGSMFKVFTARNRRERLNDERMRHDVEAKQLRSEARMIKAGEDLTATKQRMQPASQRVLGAGSDRPNIKQFVFEEEDEVQELRIHDKQGALLRATKMARAQAEEMGQDIEKDNVLIASMTERSDRVHNKLMATHNRMNRIQ